MIPPEERLLILLTLARPDARESGQALELALKVRSWETFAELAELNATVPLVYRNLERLRLTEELPTAVRQRMEAASRSIAQANEARLGVARDLFDRLAGRGIPVVILKGVLFAETLYGDPHYKRMNDVDILVQRRHLDAVFDVYAQMQFFSAAHLLGKDPRSQERHSHHAPPFFSRDLACMIGTHWGLITPLSPYRLDYDAIWSRVRDIRFYGVPAKSMAPEDNLHHLCVHLPYYKTGLRELADIYNLIRHYPDLDWDLFLREVAKARTENLVYHALALANRICPSVEAQEAMRRVEPRVSRWYRRDAQRKTASLSRLLRSRSTQMSRIEKGFADLRSTEKPREKWGAFARTMKHLWWAPSEEAARMNSLDRATLWARLRTPARIRRVFYRDVGRALFWLLFAKTCWDVVAATVAAPFRRPVDHEAYARELGVSPADMRRLKEALE